jgi:hypothetical protein
VPDLGLKFQRLPLLGSGTGLCFPFDVVSPLELLGWYALSVNRIAIQPLQGLCDGSKALHPPSTYTGIRDHEALRPGLQIDRKATFSCVRLSSG